ncbi:sortase [Nocardioides humilatus]|uniref:Sortase n=1 Tax=Nocardioides humilatus TaxID=2607660 RepID=A0A5B1LLL2_9ACTN|nr:sortase [Nocardioides humilatus]KAA1421018.1 sortase [Nocardioides humilatus]
MAATVTEESPEVRTTDEAPDAVPAWQGRLVALRRAVTRPRPRPEPGQRRAEPPPREPFEMTGANVVAIAMVMISILLLIFGAYLFGGSALSERRQQDVAFAQMKKDLALATVPVSGAIPRGTPVGIITIPHLGVEQVFEMGSSSAETRHGPGLRPDTVLPGQAGVSVLIGRRATGGAPFRDLDQLSPGDLIEVVTGQGEFTYVVDVVRTSDANVQIEPAESRLTLVTSDPAVINRRTLQVSAALDGKALPASTGLAGGASADPADLAGAHLGTHTTALLLWSQALLLVVVATTWGALRMRWRAVWIGAVPTIAALMWLVFENLTLLLPNTL